MNSIAHKFRRVFKHGGSLVITLPVELGFKIGDDVIWDIMEDGIITLKKIDIDGGVPHHMKINRESRKTALYKQIQSTGELMKEEYLMARFAIDHGISVATLDGYRDELLKAGLVKRVNDTLQVV